MFDDCALIMSDRGARSDNKTFSSATITEQQNSILSAPSFSNRSQSTTRTSIPSSRSSGHLTQFCVDEEAAKKAVRSALSEYHRLAFDEVYASVQRRGCGNYGAIIECPGDVHMDIVRLVVFTGGRFLPRLDLTTRASSGPLSLVPQDAGADDLARFNSEASKALFCIMNEEAPAALSLEALRHLPHACQYFWAEPGCKHWIDPIAHLLPAYYAPLKDQLKPSEAVSILKATMDAFGQLPSVTPFTDMLRALAPCFTRKDASTEEFKVAASQLVVAMRRTKKSFPLDVIQELCPPGATLPLDTALVAVLVAAAACSSCEVGKPRSSSLHVSCESNRFSSGGENMIGESRVLRSLSTRGSRSACNAIARAVHEAMVAAHDSLTLLQNGTRRKARAAIQLLSSSRDILSHGSCTCYEAATDAVMGLCNVAMAPFGALLANDALPKGTRIGWTTTLEGHRDVVDTVAWSPDSKWLASASWDCSVRIWDVSTGTCRNYLCGHRDHVVSVAWAADGKSIASASWDGTLRVWSFATGECSLSIEGDDAKSVAWSPSGGLIASSHRDNVVRVRSATTGETMLSLESTESVVECIAWSPDGKLLAGACHDAHTKSEWFGQGYIWSAVTGDRLTMLKGLPGQEIYSVAWSPNSKRLASAGSGDSVYIWDTSTGDATAVLEGVANGKDVFSIAWSPSGHRVASAGEDGCVRVWDPSTGACQATLEGHTSSVYGVAWSPDGKRLASAGADHTVRYV